jgi:CheY-like chemotaxis protein
MFPRHEWSAVITDRMMPGMSGDQLAASIRKLDSKVPIVLISGQCGGDGFDFDAVVPKPFTREALETALVAATSSN